MLTPPKHYYYYYYYWTVPVEGTCSPSGGGGTGPIGDVPYDPQRTAYPNPATDVLTVKQGGGPVRLVTMHGKPVSSQSAPAGEVRIVTSHVPAGLYILEFNNAAGKAVRKQVRIEH